MDPARSVAAHTRNANCTDSTASNDTRRGDFHWRIRIPLDREEKRQSGLLPEHDGWTAERRGHVRRAWLIRHRQSRFGYHARENEVF